jgi:NAD(P)-dependent dehydrogenase (short-subunit alcohol dehydrogenase family)
MDRFGRCDVLVNNAGGSPLYPSLLDVSETYFDKIVGLNMKGPFRLSAVFGAQMCTQQEGGSIINVSTMGVVNPGAHMTVYGAAKAGVENLTHSFANAYGPKVRVNCIHPGAFLTDISKAWDLKRMERAWQTGVALQRGGRPHEIVGAALYFASDASSYTTGAILAVDGGAGGYVGMRDPRHDGTKGMAKL